MNHASTTNPAAIMNGVCVYRKKRKKKPNRVELGENGRGSGWAFVKYVSAGRKRYLLNSPPTSAAMEFQLVGLEDNTHLEKPAFHCCFEHLHVAIFLLVSHESVTTFDVAPAAAVQRYTVL